MKGDHGEYKEIFVFVTEGEGVAGFWVDGVWYPMVTYRADVAEKLKVRASTISRISGQRIEMLRFTQPELMESWG